MLRINKMESLPVNSNPFLYDHFHTGTDITERGMVIVNSTKVPYVILFDTATGERYKINFSFDPDRSKFDMDLLGAHNGCLLDNSVQGQETVIY